VGFPQYGLKASLHLFAMRTEIGQRLVPPAPPLRTGIAPPRRKENRRKRSSWPKIGREWTAAWDSGTPVPYRNCTPRCKENFTEAVTLAENRTETTRRGASGLGWAPRLLDCCTPSTKAATSFTNFTLRKGVRLSGCPSRRETVVALVRTCATL
jgi:hypothetical protein